MTRTPAAEGVLLDIDVAVYRRVVGEAERRAAGRARQERGRVPRCARDTAGAGVLVHLVQVREGDQVRRVARDG